jgi:hypothetical protein
MESRSQTPMHVAVITHGLPQPNTNGGPITSWALVRQLLDEGHDATVVSLCYPGDSFTQSPERRASLRAEGAELVLVDVRPEDLETVPRREGDPLATAFPTLRLVPQFREALEGLGLDAIFAYHWDSLAATHGLDIAPRFGAVDDPWHLPNLRRWQQTGPRPSLAYLRWSVATLRGTRSLRTAMVTLLNDCDAAGAFQAETAAWLRRSGARECAYLHAPLVDPCPGGINRVERDTARIRILLGPSRLDATSTSAGLRFFAEKVLPPLERELGKGAFEVCVVGDGEPPAELRRLLPRDTVVLKGWVDEIEPEFLAADIQLSVTPFVLGKRMRLIAGWAHGLCIVAHASEAVNLPELRDEENGLLASDGPGVARALARAVRDPALRVRLGDAGRRTYEEAFQPSAAAGALVRRLEALARTPRQRIEV